MSKSKTLKAEKPLYKKLLAHFQKQYPQCEKITDLVMNQERQIIAGKWIETDGTSE